MNLTTSGPPRDVVMAAITRNGGPEATAARVTRVAQTIQAEMGGTYEDAARAAIELICAEEPYA